MPELKKYFQYAPISGTIEEINATLSGQPNLLNKAPETDGWLCKIKLSDPAEVHQLSRPL